MDSFRLICLIDETRSFSSVRTRSCGSSITSTSSSPFSTLREKGRKEEEQFIRPLLLLFCREEGLDEK